MSSLGYHAFCQHKVLEWLHGPYVRAPSRSTRLAPLRVCTALEFVSTRRWNEGEIEYAMSFSGLVFKPHGPNLIVVVWLTVVTGLNRSSLS